mgnify:CR=1 FL=1
MVKKTGLGKGLDALFVGNSTEEAVDMNNKDLIHNLKVIEVEPNKSQPRRYFDEEAIEELAESIKRYGVIQPIIVTKQDNYYEIVAGERRWRASKKAGLTEIPAIVRDNDERKNKEISLIENVQREDLNVFEKATGIKVLMEEYSLTQQEVGEIIGKSRSAVANTIRILNLDERVLDLAKEGKLTEGHCKALLSIEDNEKQYKTALHMIDIGGTVRDIEKKVQREKKLLKKAAQQYEAIYQDIENKFQSFFGTKVKLDPGKRKGKIVIEYSSNDDLSRIIDLIN